MVHVDGVSTHPQSTHTHTHVHSHLYKLNGNDFDVEHRIALNFFFSPYSIESIATHCTATNDILAADGAENTYLLDGFEKIFSFFHHVQQYIIIKFIESARNLTVGAQLQPSMVWNEFMNVCTGVWLASNKQLKCVRTDAENEGKVLEFFVPLRNKVHRTFANRQINTFDSDEII